MSDDVRFTVVLPQRTLNALRNAMTARAISGVEGGGAIDAFVLRMLTCIGEGKTEHVFTLKKDPT